MPPHNYDYELDLEILRNMSSGVSRIDVYKRQILLKQFWYNFVINIVSPVLYGQENFTSVVFFLNTHSHFTFEPVVVVEQIKLRV